MRLTWRGLLLLSALAAAPVLAYFPAVSAGRLLAPGDATSLQLPLRVEVWRAYARGEMPSWNPSIFSGVPLLASYRPGALHPLMVALAALPPPIAFQVLVLLSLAATGPLVYLCARRIGAESVGAAVAALGFALGPYLVAQLEDTATLVAAPALPVLLLATERHLRGGGMASRAGLAGAIALLALAGSPTALGAGAILLGARVVHAFVLARHEPRPGGATLPSLAVGVVCGLLLAAPQLVPTLIALAASGGGGVAFTPPTRAVLGGIAGLIVRLVSHTPATVFALAAVPLLARATTVRLSAGLAAVTVLGLAASGQLNRPGPVPLAFDLALSLLAGVSLSAQWRERAERRGRRLRLLALVAALFSAIALSIATTVTGPLDQHLSAPVGLLALGLILYFCLAGARSTIAARVFLLPLAASFLMQPWGRLAWGGAPTAAELDRGSPTRQAIDRVMGARRSERTLAISEAWPAPAAAADLAWANLATFAGRRNANGYDPLVPDLRRRALEGMRSDGTTARPLLETDPARLELLGIRWLEVPTEALVTTHGTDGLGDALDLVVDARQPHLFALPMTRASEVHLVTFLSGSTRTRQGQPVAECVALLATGREISMPIRAGVETAEWAWERPDVRPRVRHEKATVYASFPAREGFLGHQYSSVLRLPGRFLVAALRVQSLQGAPPLWLLRAGLRDAQTGRAVGVSLVSGHASDEARLTQAASTPLVSLFEVRRGVGPAWTVESLRRLPDEARLLDTLRSPTRLGVDPRREALATMEDAAGVELPAGSRSSGADVARAVGGRIVVRAVGPGLLVVAEGYDGGWTAQVDGRTARIVRVNGDRIGIVLQAGHHRVVLRHHSRGFVTGVALALLGALALGLAPGQRAAEGRRH